MAGFWFGQKRFSALFLFIDNNPPTSQTRCHRCGTCCLKGGPALHTDDFFLLREGIVDTGHLYTLRKGEIVRNTDNQLIPLHHEVIKIKGEGENTWACTFYDSKKKACRIYADRPLECRTLKCWDPGDLRQAMTRPYIQRKDLLDEEGELHRVIIAHEKRCAYQMMENAIRALQGPQPHKAVDQILSALHYDHVVRSLIPEKLKLNPDTMDFFFGRPLTTTIRMYNLEVRQEGGDFRLVPAKDNAGSP